MLIISILIVAIFFWLVLNHPFKGEVEDTYDYYLEKKEKREKERERGLR